MYDSITPTDIPLSAQMVAGYVDGLYAWPDSGWLRFPKARKVGITVTGQTLDANVADVETGDLTPAQGADWGRRMLAAGKYPVLYFSLGLWPQIKAAIEALHLQTGQFGAWVALWDGTTEINAGWLAHQYAHPPGSGGHFDLSVVADYWPGVDPPPGPAPTPTPIPAPPPPVPVYGTATVDQVRAAFGRLADALTHTFQQAIADIEQAKSDLTHL